MSAHRPAPPSGDNAVQIAGLWDANRITALTALALALPLAAALQARGTLMLAPLALALLIALGWPAIFALLRRRGFGWDGVPGAVLFVLLVPEAVPLWQQAVALSFGVVLGEQVFGGRGRNFLSPAVVALAFLLFSFPAPPAAAPIPVLTTAAAAGGLLLLVVGVLSWRIVVGFGFGVLAMVLLLAPPFGFAALIGAGLVLALVFAIGDPVASASTNPGRWLYGMLAGGLVVGLGTSGAGALHALVFAALLAGIFAPLIDQGVVWVNVRQRRGRRG
ncbi:MAG: RnfABCDGE type electron transport complex subunit D [Rhodobacteraceae bacterium]|nr:RnfABCDGE type electron transport complex subunit D [Paracoccaceae bacterium]